MTEIPHNNKKKTFPSLVHKTENAKSIIKESIDVNKENHLAISIHSMQEGETWAQSRN